MANNSYKAFQVKQLIRGAERMAIAGRNAATVQKAPYNNPNLRTAEGPKRNQLI